MAESPDLLTTREAAEHLRLSSKTLINWRSLHCGPRYVRVGGRVMYRREALRQWLDRREIDPATVPPERPGEPEPIANIAKRTLAKIERERRQ